mmetsp:Transcript_25957/g.61257  ORF Transcript_25957/g.61257 Transcript_25957/m.61257 type:complete len:131 (+) Transcript_25957:2-394(+)
MEAASSFVPDNENLVFDAGISYSHRFFDDSSKTDLGLKALEWFQRGLALSPNHRFHLEAARVLLQLNRFREAYGHVAYLPSTEANKAGLLNVIPPDQRGLVGTTDSGVEGECTSDGRGPSSCATPNGVPS